MSDRRKCIELLSEGQSQGDGAVVALSGRHYGQSSEEIQTAAANEATTREHLFLAYTTGLMNLVVVVTHMNTIPSVSPSCLQLILLLKHFHSLQEEEPERCFNTVTQQSSKMMAEIGYTPGSVVYVPMGESFGENIMDYRYVICFVIIRRDSQG